MVVIDFNSPLQFGSNTFVSSWKDLANAFGTHRFLATAGLSAQAHLRPVCSALSGQSPHLDLLLLRSISLHGLCPDNLSSKPSRHRDLSMSPAIEAVSLRHSWNRIPQYSGQSQRTTRLAHLRRFRPCADRPGANAVCRRRLRRSIGSRGVCPRLDHHRFVSDLISMGHLSSAQSRRQDPYADGPARLDPQYYPHYRRQNARCQHPRRPDLGAGALYVMDRGYLDFARLYRFTQHLCSFVTRTKRNFDYSRLSTTPVDKNTGLRCDQTIRLNGYYPSQDYPAVLRRISYVDPDTHKRLVFLTNNFVLPALTIARVYKCRLGGLLKSYHRTAA
jgi:hypothetical protein